MEGFGNEVLGMPLPGFALMVLFWVMLFVAIAADTNQRPDAYVLVSLFPIFGTCWLWSMFGWWLFIVPLIIALLGLLIWWAKYYWDNVMVHDQFNNQQQPPPAKPPAKQQYFNPDHIPFNDNQNNRR